MPWKKETLIVMDAPKSHVLLESGEALAGRKAAVGAPCSFSCCSQAESRDGRETQRCDSWDVGLGELVSCGTNCLSPDYKVLHRPVPIAWPISFMEGPIVRRQLVSFCHSNENITTVGRETLAGRQPVFEHWGHNPVSSWGPRVSVGATVGGTVARRAFAPWPHQGLLRAPPSRG